MAPQRIEVLLIDDDTALNRALQNRARAYQVALHPFEHLEAGMNELRRNPKYQAVILDGKARLSAAQARGTEAENFVHEAITQLRELELQQDRHLPFCVHTAWYEQLAPSLEGRARVFDKTQTARNEQQLAGLFFYLRQAIEQQAEHHLRQKHAPIFNFVQQYLDQEDEQLLLNILSEKILEKRSFLLEKLAFIRRLEESVLNVYCAEVLGESPEKYGTKGQSRARDLIELIKRKRLAPLHISFMTYVIYTTQSAAVQHKAPKGSDYYNYPLTPYTLRTFRNALLDIILWVADSIEQKDRN